jgi:dynein heavy chain
MNKWKGPMQFCDYILRQIDLIRKFIPLLLLIKGRGM